MADNINVNPGQAAGNVTVKTDEIDSIHWPVYKTAYGADGSATEVDADSPLPVALYPINSSGTDPQLVMIELQEGILLELKRLNLYMAEFLESEITIEDVEQC